MTATLASLSAVNTVSPAGLPVLAAARGINKMDIVYTLRDKYDSEELRFSLRSLKNIPHDKVFFVGGCPRLAKNIIHIRTEQTGTKYKNTTNNLITACNDPRISANFILMNDDFFILEKTGPKELNFYNGTVQSNIDGRLKKYPNGNPYIRGMIQTKEFLQGIGIAEPLSYELHIPIVLNKKKFLKIYDLPGVDSIPCFHKRTVYGNLYLKGGNDTRDVKVFGGDGFLPKKIGQFLSCDDMGFYVLHNFLVNKFPQKSIYEI